MIALFPKLGYSRFYSMHLLQTAWIDKALPSHPLWNELHWLIKMYHSVELFDR